MTSKDYWQVFLETGAPEMYLLYQTALKMENNNVLDNQGFGATGHIIQ